MIKIPNELRKNLTKKLKIVILPEEEKQTTLSKLLLDAPTWDESDVMDFHEKIREGYENWKIKVDPMSRPTSSLMRNQGTRNLELKLLTP
jgi:hypothetical protein